MKVNGRVGGKVALVSGAARGMGAAHARRLVEEGARVVVADLLDKEGEALVAELGDAARYVHLDVTDYDAWQAAVNVAVETFGGLDVLVNNAGIANAAPIEDYSVDAWHSILSVNLTGTFYGIKAAIAPLRTGGRGSIVNISSTAGIKSYGHMAGYTASKFGVRGLTKAAALDLGRYGIRVNSVHPGGIRTPMTEGVTVQENLALGRLGEPGELAEVVLFLASDESSYATGTEFVIDGGETAGQTR
ncbi:SDR family oxidoreductase [Streptomyces sp. NPDC005077]|uniref:SDR family oxidoreductase n=1 Tax=Streptomyces sp. NPDC005077 TaxID=3154292 RepID=UPI0033A35EB1